jgi:hypothetical protein
MMAGKPKADQVRRSGAHVVVAACENCRLQLGDLSGFYGLGIGVTALADLVVKAMRLPGHKSTVEHFMTADSNQSIEVGDGSAWPATESVTIKTEKPGLTDQEQ